MSDRAGCPVWRRGINRGTNSFHEPLHLDLVPRVARADCLALGAIPQLTDPWAGWRAGPRPRVRGRGDRSPGAVLRVNSATSGVYKPRSRLRNVTTFPRCGAVTIRRNVMPLHARLPRPATQISMWRASGAARRAAVATLLDRRGGPEDSLTRAQPRQWYWRGRRP